MMSLHPSHAPLPPPQIPVATHNNLRLRDSHDAHILFQAVRQGHLPLIRKRLTGPEQQALHAGQVFVWADREGSLERWTDGHNWSPSRVRGPFLMYDEMPEDTEAFLRRKQQQKNGERRVKQPRKKRLPPLPGGLSKQTYSATLMQQGMDIQKWHLTAYFKDDGSNDLLTIDDDPLLRTIIVPDHTFKSSMSRKSKSSSSRRRGSVSERRSDADADEYCDRRESPIDEYSPTRSTSFPSPPLNPVLSSPFDFGGSSGSGPVPSLPWDLQRHSSGSYSSTDDPNGGSGSSNGSAGSAGTVHGDSRMHNGFSARAGHYQPYPAANIHRGRPMHLEGIHTRFESAHPSLGFTSTMSPNTDVPGMVPPSRSQSLSGLPSAAIADWKPFDMDETRRGSLMSIGSSRSTSSQSTSTSSKLPSNGGVGVSSSNSSSPASSWSGQSPYLNPTVASSNWPAFGSGQGSPPLGQNRIKHEHISSPLGSVSPIVPSSMPSGAGASPYRSIPLPSHLQHHPEHVPSAVPPQQPQQPARRSTLPALYSSGSSLSPYAPDSALSSAWSPSSNVTSPYQSLPSPYESTLPDSATYRLPPSSSYFPQQQDTKPTAAELHHPRAVTATGIPGSWEQANTTSYNFNGATTDLNSPGLTEQQYQFAAAAAGSYAIPAPGEVFDSVVPTNSSAWSASS